MPTAKVMNYIYFSKYFVDVSDLIEVKEYEEVDSAFTFL